MRKINEENLTKAVGGTADLKSADSEKSKANMPVTVFCINCRIYVRDYLHRPMYCPKCGAQIA